MASILVAFRHLRDDRATTIVLGLLILVTATVFGLAPRLVDQVGNDALRGVVAAASAFNRNIALLEEQILPSDPRDPLRIVQEEGDHLDGRIPASVLALVAAREVVIDSVRYQIQAPSQDPSFIRFRIQPGAIERIHFIAGVAPTASHQLIELPPGLRHLLPQEDPPTSPPSSAPVSVPLLEVAISSEAARQTSRSVGDTVFLSVDGRDPLAGRRAGVVATRISGIFEVNDTADPFWFEDQSINQVGIRTIGGDTRFIDVGGLLATGAYDVLIQSGAGQGIPVRITWRHFVDPARFASAALGPLIVDLRRLETTFPRTQATNVAVNGTAMRSGLLPLLVGHAARWASATALLTVVAVGPAVVALVALGLIALIAARRRRPTLALVRGRGASVGQVLRAVILEGCLVAIPAVAIAILLAVLVVPTDSNRPTIAAATMVGLVAVGLLVLTAIPGTAAARAPREDDRVPRDVSARRLVVDLVIILFATGGAWLLRERGVRGSSSTGTLAAADPLIAAVPALAGIAAGLTAIRLVGLPLRLLGRLAGRGRGLVPLLALRRAIHGGTTAAVLVVLLAASSIGAFSSAALVHLNRASTAASWHEIGAPFRVDAQVGSLPASLDPMTIPGVRSAAALFRVQIPIGVRNVQVQFVAVDLAAYQRLTAGTAGDAAIPPEMLGPEVPNGVIPLLVSQSLLDRTDGAQLGQQFEVVVEGYHYQVVPIEARTSFATLATDTLFMIASRQQMRTIHPLAQLSATTLFLDAPGDAGPAIANAVTTAVTGATVANRATFARAFSDSPVTAAIFAATAMAAVVAGLYAALAVAAALVLAGAARATEEAHLRMMGLSRRASLGLAIVEHGPIVIVAFVVGLALGLGLFALLEPSLGLDAIVGSRIAVPFSADPGQVATILGGVLLIAVLGVGLAAWMQRRGVAVASLRRGIE